MKGQTNQSRRRLCFVLALGSLITAATLVMDPARRVSAQTIAPNWSYTSNLNTARSLHTATLLQNGKVLVAGGNAGDDLVVPSNSAELYDPSTGTWSTTGNLNSGHASHTATLLQNGKVLVAGGLECFSYFEPCFAHKNAELYDPDTGTWSVTGDLNTARYAFTATRLPDGKVLVVGDGFRRRDAELYDPATGTWSYTGALNTATSRFNHAATLLPNGKVLVAGGGYCSNEGCFRLDSSELYDPATGTWSITGNLITGRFRHSTTLLPNGKVLAVAGGYYTVDGQGFYSNFHSLKSAELYDPAAGAWSSTSDLNGSRGSHSATLLPGGKVLVAGGDINNPETCELYDPIAATWANTASFNIPRYEPTATLLPNGKVLAIGDGGNTAELYHPGTSPTPNQIDDVQFFVRQQYLDFLGREPDIIGFQNWVDTLANCPNGGFGEFDNPNCDRVHVSAGFYLSEEFRGRGYWAYRFYQVSLGRAPLFVEFGPDILAVGGPKSPEEEASSKQAFTNAWVTRADFKAKYDALDSSGFVDALLAMAGVSLPNRDALVSALQNGQKNRAQVLREIAESKTVEDKFFIKAFVSMQYFGYLKRDPDTTGYQNWVQTFTDDPANFRHMIFGFIYSTEYRQRFGQP